MLHHVDPDAVVRAVADVERGAPRPGRVARAGPRRHRDAPGVGCRLRPRRLSGRGGRTRASYASASRAGATRRGAARSIRPACRSGASSSTRRAASTPSSSTARSTRCSGPWTTRTGTRPRRAGFVFAVKGPRYVTHLLALRERRGPARQLLRLGAREPARQARPAPLAVAAPAALRSRAHRRLPRPAAARHGARPPRSRGDTTNAWRVAPSWTTATARPLRHALEVRHPSFVDPSFVALLREHGVALVVADTAGKWPRLEDVTADFVYLRLHGDAALYVSGYSRSALARWAARIGRWRAGGEPDDVARASPIGPRPRSARRLLLLRQRREGARTRRRAEPAPPGRRRPAWAGRGCAEVREPRWRLQGSTGLRRARRGVPHAPDGCQRRPGFVHRAFVCVRALRRIKLAVFRR